MTYLLVKIFSVDYQTIGALLRRTNSEVRHIFHHFLHAKPIQFNASEFFVAVVIRQSECESQSCGLLSKTTLLLRLLVSAQQSSQLTLSNNELHHHHHH